mmetsp:Transcript_4074/g.11506  ORF Transcript_4074/g.11506 Transcript_4074/m.11506 type:complete len:340 (-) Transcript_4074:298-1317(-)
MTTDELNAYRKEVMQRLQAPGLPGLTSPIPIFQFSDKAITAAGVQHQVPPFAVVSSNITDPTVGPFWPVRRYNWGTCEAFRSRDSDFACLKHLLLELSYWEIRDATEKRYTEYRKKRRGVERLQAEKSPRTGQISAFLSMLSSEGSRLWQAARTLPAQAHEDSLPALPPAATSWELTAVAVTACLLNFFFSWLVSKSEAPGADVIGHYIADLRDREVYISQLQGEALGLLGLLEDAATSACLLSTPGASHSAHRLRETVADVAFGDVCYDEDYKPGAPWLLRLLVMGSVVYTAWATCNHHQLQALIQDRLSRAVIRVTICSMAMSCLHHIWHLFAATAD